MSGYVPRKLRDRSGVSRTKSSRAITVEADGSGSPKKSRSGSSARTSPKRRPSPGGARRPSPKARTTLASYKRPARTLKEWRRLAVNLTLAALVALLLAGVTWVGSGYSGLQLAGVFGRSADVVADAKRDAKTAASALLSYDYRNFNASIKNGKAHTTGHYEKQYVDFLKDLASTVKKEKATVEAQVVDLGTVETDATCSPKKGPSYSGIEFLAFVNQITRNKNIEGSRIDKSRVVLCMTETAEGWQVADLKAL